MPRLTLTQTQLRLFYSFISSFLPFISSFISSFYFIIHFFLLFHHFFLSSNSKTSHCFCLNTLPPFPNCHLVLYLFPYSPITLRHLYLYYNHVQSLNREDIAKYFPFLRLTLLCKLIKNFTWAILLLKLVFFVIFCCPWINSPS